MFLKNKSLAIFGLGAFCLLTVASQAATIRVTFDASGPVGFAPLFSIFHDGSHDTFDAGSAASAGLETLAEVGDPGGLIATAVAGSNAGAVVGSPVIPAGMSASAVFNVDAANTMFSYASMVLPSNDWFVGNDSAVDVSALLGGALGSQQVINISSVWDAGTELEDFAFSPGNPLAGLPGGDAPNGTVQGGTVALVAGADPFASFSGIPAGFDTTALDFNSFGGPIGRITLEVIPEPGTSALLGLALFFGILRRRR